MLEGSSARARLADALKVIQHSLENQPLEWGEPHYDLKHLKITVCVGFHRRYCAAYGVHRDQRIVFIRELRDMEK
jgi:hypothetical protein